jgi:hypothetical protein
MASDDGIPSAKGKMVKAIFRAYKFNNGNSLSFTYNIEG